MYDYIEIGLMVLVGILGTVMFAMPVRMTKEENRRNESDVARTKKSGLTLMILGYAFAIILFLMEKVL